MIAFFSSTRHITISFSVYPAEAEAYPDPGPDSEQDAAIKSDP